MKYGTGRIIVMPKASYSLCSSDPTGTFSLDTWRLTGGNNALVARPILELNLHEGLWGDSAHQHISDFFVAIDSISPASCTYCLEMMEMEGGP